jgi:hypothetical protein
MGLKDKLTAGLDRAAAEAGKAIDKGKAKVGELQIEMQMDGLAKKLGYVTFDAYRGRQTDEALRQKHLDDLSRLEDQLTQAKAAAAAKAEADAAAKAAQQGTQAAAPTTGAAEAAAEATDAVKAE